MVKVRNETVRACCLVLLCVIFAACNGSPPGDFLPSGPPFLEGDPGTLQKESDLPPIPHFKDDSARLLSENWNLVSFPIAENTKASELINSLGYGQNIRSIWHWDNNLGASGMWRVFPQTGDFALLTSITPDAGYWVRMRQATEMTGTGVSRNLYELSNGWNLIGYSHSAMPTSVSDFLFQGKFWEGTCGDQDGLISLWAWDEKRWKAFFPDSGGLLAFNLKHGESIEPLTHLEPGMGLWLNASRANTPPPIGGCPSTTLIWDLSRWDSKAIWK